VLLPVYSSRTPVKSTEFYNPEGKLKGIMQQALGALESLPGKSLGHGE
jgi:hypothetical protein